MPDDGDSGGIVEEIVDTAGDVGGAIVSELAKLGKTAASQVTGSEPSLDRHSLSANKQSFSTNKQSFSANRTSPKSGGAKQPPVSTDSDHSILSEFKKFGQTAIGQITGHGQEANISAMKKKDDEASRQEYREIKSKIDQIYAQYAARRAREQKQQELIQVRQEEEQQKQLVEIKKKEVPRADIAKTRAEIKNYGAE